MDATLNLHNRILSFVDRTVNNNPRLRPVDWDRQAEGIPVSNPRSTTLTIPVGGSTNVFDGIRSTSIDGTTTFSLGLLSTSPSSYRITHTAGTAPGFRANRALTLNGIEVTFTVNANYTVNLSVSTLAASDFAAVQDGDIIFIPNTSTGDSLNVISPLNSGYWQVLSKTDSENIVLSRGVNAVFEAVGETVTLTANSQLTAFGSSGVQVGDVVTISNGFAISALSTFTVTAVTNSFIEFVSTVPLANQSGIQPGASGMIFYTDAQRFVYLESDQDCVVRINGDTGDYQRVSPIEAGNPDLPGFWQKWGNTFSLTIVNKSAFPAKVLVIYAE